MNGQNDPARPELVEGWAEAPERRSGVAPQALAAYFNLLHPLPVALTVLASTGFALIAAHGRPSSTRLALLLVSVLLTQLAISIHNDYCDRNLDSRAKPWRAIPSGLVAPAVVLRWSLTLALLGFLASAPLGAVVAGLAVAGTAAGFIYNVALKRGVWSWLPFWLGFPTLVLWSFAAMGRLEARLWSVYLIGLPLVLAIHLADTLPDLESDGALGLHGMAHRLGPTQARLVCWVALVLALVLALSFQPARDPKWPRYIAAGLVAVTILLGWQKHERLHWLAIMGSVSLVALLWLATLVG